MTKFKLITYIDRINVFSDVFFRHYLKIFTPEEFHIMTFGGAQENLKQYLESFGFTHKNIVPINRARFGFGENVYMQNRVKSEYIRQKFIVFYADIDELIWHPDLKNYVAESKENFICTNGIQIVQNVDEDFLDKSKPILEQRSWCQPDYYYYSKLCILKQDFIWTAGRHNKGTIKVDPSVYLIDIGKVCRNLMLENNIKTKELYSIVMQRYRIAKKEGMDEEYKKHLTKLALIPPIIKESRLF